MTLLEIAKLTGGYGETDILNGIDLTIAAGEILTVAGTNGAGKSTLARALMGLLPRVAGRVVLEGRDIIAEPVERRLALGIAYVPQVGNVFASLSVLENLQVVQGVVDARARIAELLAAFPALAERRRARAGSLSGGERQQLAFARALMARPRLMILDEPTAALAPARVAESFARIRALPAMGVSVLMVEQRARQALAVSDRGCILDGGCVTMLGPAAELLADESAAALYLGRAAAG
ncbi:ABC transporter ATP-binding protein [Roseomonas rosulenta]|uniref:ABC transporter ATP-binding protein n=1 Tax=Roseomonas rosulenta TaxID=2748667 RepID=UPI0018E03394|nr:ABC transporter ATP-binding protein [Roseomonas rosulenta]